MASQTGPDLIYAGASRCGSTWLHRALDDHPEIAMAQPKPLNFFDTKYHRGVDWYTDTLPEHPDGGLVGESSPGYMKNMLVPERIADRFPDVKIVFTVRDPVDRAFSEWWHERSFGNVTWEFEQARFHHPSFDMLFRPGFYDHFLDQFENHFESEQLKIAFFDDFTSDNECFIQDIYGFLGVDDTYTPTLVGERVNEASHLSPRLNRLKSWVYHTVPNWLLANVLQPGYRPLKGILESGSPYKQGIDPEIRTELEMVFTEDVRALEARTGRDLSHWC